MGVFHFKQFSICDDDAVMKVGTDAVLLGAWTDISNSKNILDIGTGSGVIALILAQRSAAFVKIDAIELHEVDALQARRNVQSSPWPEKIVVHHARLQTYSPNRRYDLLICNPPFFTASQLPHQSDRARVRHDIELNADELLAAATRLMALQGLLSIILPTAEAELLIQKAGTHGLFLNRLTRLFTRRGRPQERSLMQFSFQEGELTEDLLLIYTSGSNWSADYRSLVGAYYLAG